MSIDDLDTYYRLINKFNGYRNLYRSVFNFKEEQEGRVVPNSAVIDMLPFDFDENSYENMIKLHEGLDGFLHRIYFSGDKGYHAYIETEPMPAREINLGAAQKWVEHKTGAISDQHIIGDVNRVLRIPNTVHTRSKLFCIQIGSQEILLGDKGIRKLATKPRPILPPFGYKKYPLEKAQSHGLSLIQDYRDSLPDHEPNTERAQELLGDTGDMPPCIVNILGDDKLGWKPRFYLILYLKEKGYSLGETDAVLKSFLTPQKYKHCVYREKQLKYVYKRGELVFPRKNKLVMEGFCKSSKCNQCEELYR